MRAQCKGGNGGDGDDNHVLHSCPYQVLHEALPVHHGLTESSQPHRAGITITPILQMRKPGVRESK